MHSFFISFIANDEGATVSCRDLLKSVHTFLRRRKFSVQQGEKTEALVKKPYVRKFRVYSLNSEQVFHSVQLKICPEFSEWTSTPGLKSQGILSEKKTTSQHQSIKH